MMSKNFSSTSNPLARNLNVVGKLPKSAICFGPQKIRKKKKIIIKTMQMANVIIVNLSDFKTI